MEECLKSSIVPIVKGLSFQVNTLMRQAFLDMQREDHMHMEVTYNTGKSLNFHNYFYNESLCMSMKNDKLF